MQLDRLQRRSLGLYVRFRDEQPSLFALLRVSGWRLVFVLSYCLAAAAFFYYIDSPVGTAIILGFLLGYMSFYIAQMRVFLRLWPVFREVLDWNKVMALVGR